MKKNILWADNFEQEPVDAKAIIQIACTSDMVRPVLDTTETNKDLSKHLMSCGARSLLAKSWQESVEYLKGVRYCFALVRTKLFPILFSIHCERGSNLICRSYARPE